MFFFNAGIFGKKSVFDYRPKIGQKSSWENASFLSLFEKVYLKKIFFSSLFEGFDNFGNFTPSTFNWAKKEEPIRQ